MEGFFMTAIIKIYRKQTILKPIYPVNHSNPKNRVLYF
jgi:hypothetical protein